MKTRAEIEEEYKSYHAGAEICDRAGVNPPQEFFEAWLKCWLDKMEMKFKYEKEKRHGVTNPNF